MPQASCKFVGPQLSNVAQGPKAQRQHLTTLGQQICMMLKVLGLICFVISQSDMQ